MLVLETNHFSEWERDSAAGRRLRARLEATRPDMSVAIVTVEEELRGWLAEVSRHRDLHRQISAYAKLQRQVEVLPTGQFYLGTLMLPKCFWSSDVRGVRIGTLDLKIACIALAHDATLLTRDANDFAKVPGLRVENWLD